jgi:small subunit ribosomal protein S2
LEGVHYLAKLTIKQLLEAGVHFGHQTQRWNPKMKKYIFGDRNGIHIINLEMTVACLERALDFVTDVAAQGKEILFVGTKKQAQESIREAAERCEMPYVHQRWLGGMLTNFGTVRKSVARLEWIDQMEQDGNFKFMKKKEAGMLGKEREKLLKNLYGVRRMKHVPAAIFVIDSNKEEIAIHEAVKLGIPIVAILDTNCNPDKVDLPIPGNDDAIRAIKLYCSLMADAVNAGREQAGKLVPQPESSGQSEEAPAGTAADSASSEEDAESTTGDKEVLPEDKIEEELAAPFSGEEVETEEQKKLRLKKTPRKEGLRVKK